MRFSFTEDQRLLAEAVRDVLAKTCTPDAIRAGERPGKAWRALTEVGLLGAHIGEERDGLGLAPVDTVLAYEETGWFALPGPLVETAVVAPELLRDEPKRLEAIAAGRLVVSARPADSPYFPDADLADLLLIAGPGSEVAIAEPTDLNPVDSVDATRPLFTASMPVPERSSSGLDAFDRAALATAAQLLGLGRRLREDAVSYAKQRRQFGKAIGSFQAVKHQFADVAVCLEFAAPLVYRAAYSLTHAASTSSRDVSAAKNAAGEAAHRAARTALQVHGAIGYTDELDLHLWLNRVWTLRAAWGDEGLHRKRLRDALFPNAMPRPRPMRVP
jgi:alkylation response protein AidB-like acyl-CoA dehydrogenase